MKLLSLLALFVAMSLLVTLSKEAQTAPAPNENESAKTSLAALKRKLPELLKEQLADRNRWRMSYESKIKSLRQIDSNEAKLTIFLEAASQAGAIDSEVIFIYLKHHDGIWTSSRFETTFIGNRATNKGILFLMAAIDELADQEAGK
jgi:hypothetical protein